MLFLLWLGSIQDARLPVPDAAAQALAERQVRKAYAEDYAALPGGRPALARKLLPRGVQHRDPATKYVMLRESRDHAALAGDTATAQAACHELALAFQMDGLIGKLDVLRRAEKAAGPEAWAAELSLVEEAVELGRYDVGAQILTHVERSAKAARHDATLELARERAKKFQEAQRLAAAIDAARKAGPREWWAPWGCLNGASFDVGLGTFNGRGGVWRSHPVGPDRPFTWRRSVRLGDAAHRLHLEVSAAPPGATTPDWVLVVLGNDKELLREVIRGTRWRAFDVDLSPFRGQVVRLELRNAMGGAAEWHEERAFWDNVWILPPPLAEAGPEEDPFRAAVPDAAGVARGEKACRELLKGAGAKPFPSAAEKAALAGRLLELAGSATGDEVLFVLQRDARELALQAGDAALAFRAIEAGAKLFRVDPWSEKWAALARLKAPADAYLALAERAAEAGAADVALNALARAERLAKKDPSVPERAKAVRDLARKTWSGSWTGRDGASEHLTRGMFNGRANVLVTHPLAAEKPFRWTRRVRLPAGPCSLRFEVSARPKAAEPCDWLLGVLVNGKEVHSRVVAGTAWIPVKVDLTPFAGQEVDLELLNGPHEAWHFELAYWDAVYVAFEP